MISIIISSVKKDELQDVKYNIDKTIGVPYELLAFDNSKGQQGICEIYNKGSRQAKYELLCFMHEDVEIKTGNWGMVVVEAFRKYPLLGLLGVMGASYKSLAPSGWVVEGGVDERVFFVNAIQRFKYTELPAGFFYRNSGKKRLARVACVDGVWFCTKKSHALEFPFDERLLKGFHGYDIDFSLGINQKYDAAVTFDILLEHFSEGKFDDSWMRDILKVHKKWSHSLPLDRHGFSKKEIYTIEKRAFRHLLNQLTGMNFSVWKMYKILWDTRVYKQIGPVLFLKLHIDIIKQFVKQLQTSPH